MGDKKQVNKKITPPAGREKLITNQETDEDQILILSLRPSRLNDFVGEGIDEYHRKVYNGQTRLYKFSLLVAVQGLTKKDVDHTGECSALD